MNNLKYTEIYPLYKEKVSVFFDRIIRTKKNWEECVTDFLNPDEQTVLMDMCKKEGVFVTFMGGKEYFERAIAVISASEYNDKFPIEVIKVNGNFKFEKLTHRDYLGAILSLGIKREKIGDINVFEDGAEIWLSSDIGDYICFNLSKIKHTGIKCEKIKYEYAREKLQEFKELNINIPSMRLDCVISSLTKLSRNVSVSLISGGDIKLNYNIEVEASKKINQGDLLSIKGFGRYQVIDIINTTKSQRLNVAVKKYI